VADTKTIDNGTLTDFTIATDEIAGTEYQIIKLADGTLNSTELIAGTAANGLDVDVTRLPGSAEADISSAATDLGTLAGAVAGSEVQSDIVAMPAAARTTDSIAAVSTSDAIMQNLTARTPVFAVIDGASAGDNTLVAAQGSGNKIRVHQLFIVNGHTATQTVRFESGAGGTALTGQMILAANGGFVLPFSPIGWFETAANTLLNLELAGATTVDGNLMYTVVT
jgi:hypothetical protein